MIASQLSGHCDVISNRLCRLQQNVNPASETMGVCFPRCRANRETSTKLTLSWAHKQSAARVHTLLYISTNSIHNQSKANQTWGFITYTCSVLGYMLSSLWLVCVSFDITGNIGKDFGEIFRICPKWYKEWITLWIRLLLGFWAAWYRLFRTWLTASRSSN